MATATGIVNLAEAWRFLPKTERLRASPATYKLQYGGTGSGKSANTLMHGVLDYLLRWDGCYMLVLRRVYDDLKKSLIPDLHTYVPNELFKYNQTDHAATFYNGSMLFFGHLPNNSEKDLYKYQSASFPLIFADECAQFSPDAISWLSVRNRVNPQCKANKQGEYPVPTMAFCTNPIGPFWNYYNNLFIKKRPHEMEPGTRRDKNGCYWVQEAGEWRLAYDPQAYDAVQSTLYDNPYLMAKDPALLQKLQQLPKDRRDKFLLGLADSAIGQYFDNWQHEHHVVNLRLDPEAVKWQSWQPRWMGWDWGRAHYGAAYWFTKALVRVLSGEYRLKTVCYRELVMKEKDNVSWANEVARLNGGDPLHAVYFSHERFAKQMDAHAPADELSRLLRERGLPPVTRATTNRVGRATLTYNMLDRGALAILDTCPNIVEALPQLIRAEKDWEDVEKVDGKGDDCYDGFTLGLFGMLGARAKPEDEVLQERAQAIADPFARAVFEMKVRLNKDRKAPEVGVESPAWMGGA